ncbi:hypothetical protein F0225_18305 [Vibrio pectenicida]|uniref:Uncharacterized protein n=1 Tax=Vibrio pectenicida TaxID=62763 RepID=A0A7Y4A261_9VIBR|nr:hypothetical protein [Vibrio pectenicida]NOH73272.1 hypothetical protein [Vibrio pectenicida]
MEKAIPYSHRLLSVLKWFSFLIITIVCTRFIDPTIDAIQRTIVNIAASVSTTYQDRLYETAAQVYSEDIIYTGVLLSLSIALSLMLFLFPIEKWLPESKLTKYGLSVCKLLCGVSIYATSIVAIVEVTIKNPAHTIRSATLTQIEIVRSYAHDADKFYSQFLLVKNQQDFIELWSSVILVAEQNNVVLDKFEDLAKEYPTPNSDD